jgi:hypothetical protein
MLGKITEERPLPKELSAATLSLYKKATETFHLRIAERMEELTIDLPDTVVHSAWALLQFVNIENLPIPDIFSAEEEHGLWLSWAKKGLSILISKCNQTMYTTNGYPPCKETVFAFVPDSEIFERVKSTLQGDDVQYFLEP